MTHEARLQLLIDERFPLSARYDPRWLDEHKMGGPCLWLMESLCRLMTLKPGMRVLDLGCGKALTSIFLAREFGVTVFAQDLWISADDNFKRIQEASVSDRVFPLHGDARALPYARGFFDAVVSVNSFQFFATDDTYLIDHLSPLLRPQGQLGVVQWGPEREIGDHLPAGWKKTWWPDFYYYHSLDWWRRHIEQTGLYQVEAGDDLGGEGVWVTHRWAEFMEKSDTLHQDGFMRWNRLVARRNALQSEELRTGW